MLDPSQRRVFAEWKSSVVKSCSPKEAFGLGDQRGVPERGIDAGAFLRSNQQSLRVRLSPSEEVILGNWIPMPGSSTARFEESSSAMGAMGSSVRLEAEGKREGSRCTIYLYGQKVHEANILRSWEVVAHLGAVRTSQSLSVDGSYAPEAGGVVQYPENVLSKVLRQAAAPDSHSVQLLAQRYELTPTEAEWFFPIASRESLSSALRLSQPESPWQSPDQALYLPKSVATQVFGQSSSITTFEWVIELPSIRIVDDRNSNDPRLLRVNGTFTVTLAGNTPREYQIGLSGLSALEPMSTDGAQASQCVLNRGQVIKNFHGASESRRVLPALSEIIAPCRILSPEVETAAVDDGTWATLLAQVLRGVEGNTRTDFQGWDRILTRVAIRISENGGNVSAQLDPEGRSTLVRALAEYLTEVREQLRRRPALQGASFPLKAMSSQWAMQGMAVGQDRLERIMNALEKSYRFFPASSEALIQDLAAAPENQDVALRFAENLSAEYTNTALEALGYARSLVYASWEAQVYNRIIQTRPSLEELHAWARRLKAIQAEVSRYPNLTAVRGTLVELAMKPAEQDGIPAAEIGSVFAALSKAIDVFPESVNRLMRSLNESYEKSQETLAFAAGLTSEYQKLAMSFREGCAAVDLDEWGSEVYGSILQRRPSQPQLESWLQSIQGAREFTHRERLRDSGYDPIADGYRRNLIRKAVDEGWTADDFVTTEQMAVFGRMMIGCGIRKTVSSVVQCVGMNYFSRAQGKLLDPVYAHRYGRLAAKFAGHLDSLGFQFDALRSRLRREFFEPVWGRCSADVFTSKSMVLEHLIGELIRELDARRRWEIEREIKKTLANC